MDRKQIIVITFSLSNNGADRVFSELADEWSRQGHDVTVVQFEENAFGSESFELRKDVRFITLNHRTEKNKIKKYLEYARDIRRLIRDNPKAVIVAYSFTTQVITVLSSFFTKNRIVFSERNDPNRCPYSRFTRFIRTVSFFRANRCVFQTRDAMGYFPKSIQKKGTIIVNPINPKLPDVYEGVRRNTVVTASRLRPQKNLSLLIDAFEEFYRKRPDYSLEIYGIGEEKEMLEEKIRQKKLEHAVFLKGFSKDVYQNMKDCAMYVCSSDYEGISNSMLEAIGMGIPTVSTDCPIGGARQIIRDGINGLLVPVRDRESLCKAMERIAGDSDFAAALSQNGLELRKQLSADRIAEKWLSLM